MREPYGYVTSKLEFGDPDSPDDVRRMADFSPYHLVREGAAYPAVFIDAGDTDPRCPPWHARKFAARLQAANSADTPILLHIWENVGHGWATDKDIQITEHTEWLAFLMQQLLVGVSAVIHQEGRPTRHRSRQPLKGLQEGAGRLIQQQRHMLLAYAAK